MLCGMSLILAEKNLVPLCSPVFLFIVYVEIRGIVTKNGAKGRRKQSVSCAKRLHQNRFHKTDSELRLIRHGRWLTVLHRI